MQVLWPHPTVAAVAKQQTILHLLLLNYKHQCGFYPATGKRYSVDKTTGESTWVDQHHSGEEVVKQAGTPQEPAIATEEKVLETHAIHTDPATGKRYSIDKITGESMWLDE